MPMSKWYMRKIHQNKPREIERVFQSLIKINVVFVRVLLVTSCLHTPSSQQNCWKSS